MNAPTVEAQNKLLLLVMRMGPFTSAGNVYKQVERILVEHRGYELDLMQALKAAIGSKKNKLLITLLIEEARHRHSSLNWDELVELVPEERRDIAEMLQSQKPSQKRKQMSDTAGMPSKKTKSDTAELEEEVNMLRQQLKESNTELAKYKDELKWAREWQKQRERQYEDELEYSKQYDDDGYCRYCGKSSCRC